MSIEDLFGFKQKEGTFSLTLTRTELHRLKYMSEHSIEQAEEQVKTCTELGLWVAAAGWKEQVYVAKQLKAASERLIEETATK